MDEQLKESLAIIDNALSKVTADRESHAILAQAFRNVSRACEGDKPEDVPWAE
jgi:hypothetical protein